jgi:hypothetical protein
VIELGAFPLRRVVAGFTGQRKASSRVIGSGSPVVSGPMAVHACRGRPRELAVGMAGGASHAGMFAGQRKTREIVIELCILPLNCRVTTLALEREIRCAMIRIGGPVVVRHMAAAAGLRSALELPAGVTGRARDGGVRSRESETREGRVIETGVQPRGCRVTRVAGSRKSRCDVVGIGGLRKIRLMAADALRRR